VVKELHDIKSLHSTTTGKDLFLSVCETMKEISALDKTKGVTRDRAPSMIGKKTGMR
jgi:hypothetical protein